MSSTKGVKGWERTNCCTCSMSMQIYIPHLMSISSKTEENSQNNFIVTKGKNSYDSRSNAIIVIYVVCIS